MSSLTTATLEQSEHVLNFETSTGRFRKARFGAPCGERVIQRNFFCPVVLRFTRGMRPRAGETLNVSPTRQ